MDTDPELILNSHYRSDSDRLKTAKLFMWGCANSLKERADPMHHLQRFEECYTVALMLVDAYDQDLSAKIKQIEQSANLLENIGKIAAGEDEDGCFDRLLPRRSLFFGVRGGCQLRIGGSDVLFTAETSTNLQGALARLAGLCGVGAVVAVEFERHSSDVFRVDGFYDPQHTPRQILVSLLTNALENLDQYDGLPEASKKQLVGELETVIRDVRSPRPGWTRVIASTVQITLLLAALINATANAPKALENAHAFMKQASDLIASRSIEFGHDGRGLPIRQLEGQKETGEDASINDP